MKLRFWFALWLLTAVPVSLFGADARELFPDQPKGLGEHFTAWKLSYVGETFANLSGGYEQRAIYEGYLKLGFGVNLDKVFGWENTVFYVNVAYPHGDSLTNQYVGDLNVVSNIDTYDSVRLFKCWVQRSFADDRFSLRVGIMAVDKDFFASEGAGLFLNSGFGAFPVIGQDLTAPVYPVSAPGVRAVLKPAEGVSIRAAIFSGDVGTPTNNQHNTRFLFRGLDAFVEVAWSTVITGVLKGTYKVGGFYNSESFADLRDRTQHGGNYGVYVIGDQQLWHERPEASGAQGLSAFARLVRVPADRNFVQCDAEAGFTYVGLFPNRDSDIFGLGVIYTQVSGGQARDDAGAPFASHHESVVEVSYQAPINSHFTVQPDLQYVVNPGAVHQTQNALVAGLRVTLNF
jgi:porin